VKNIIKIPGGGELLPRLCLLWFLTVCCFTVFGQQPPYRGAITDFDYRPNQFFTLDADGNIVLGDTFWEGEWRFWLDPRGIILIGKDSDFETKQTANYGAKDKT